MYIVGGVTITIDILQIRERDRLQGRTVLELGAGMGLCGLLVSKLGALEVVITDCHYPGLKVRGTFVTLVSSSVGILV